MKRLGRWLFNLAAVVSGALWLGCVALEIGGFVRPGTVGRLIGRTAVNATIARGSILIFAREFTDLPSSRPSNAATADWWAEQPVRVSAILNEPPAHSFMGFGFGPGKSEAELERMVSQRFWNVQQNFRNETQPKDARPGDASLPPLHRYDIPIWFLVIITGMLPSAWLAMYLKERSRARIGHCQRCGYDLRATPQRCPECGAAAPPAPPRP